MHRNLMRPLTGDDNELVLQFSVTFSRFEYALKRAKFVRGDNNDNALPDWSRFAKEKGNALFNDITDTDREFIEARSFLLREPPQKQKFIVSESRVEWRANPKQPRESDSEYLLRLVRDVRNNLFHGGKYPTEVVSGPRLRNSSLLQACLTILEKCSSLDANVKRFFEDLYEA